MAATLIQEMIAALDECPCCGAPISETNDASDGIPNGCVHEAVFTCGAAAFVTDSERYEVGRACPSGLDRALDELQRGVEEDFDVDEEVRQRAEAEEEADQP